MPGPAGGAGGGGFGGGSRGTGGRGGMGGGYGGHHHHHHYHRPYGGFFFFPWGRPYYGYGGGFFGGLIGLFLLPVLLLLLAGVFLASSIISLISAISTGGIVQYDEGKFQDYANSQYQAIYGSYAEAYEDNILIVFTTTEELDGYYTIVWAGDNVSSDINLMFGANKQFGTAMDTNVLTSNYKYSLDSNLAMVVEYMERAITSSGVKSFKRDVDATHAEPTVINRDEDLQFSATTTQLALESFTEKTGIPISIVIEDEEDVFGRTIPASYIISGVISLGICIFAGVWIYKSVKAKKAAERQRENQRNGTDYNDPRYWN